MAEQRILELKQQAFSDIVRSVIWIGTDKQAGARVILELKDLLEIDKEFYKDCMKEHSTSRPKPGSNVTYAAGGLGGGLGQQQLSQHQQHGFTPPPNMASRAAAGGNGTTPRGSTGGGKKAAIVTLGEKSGPWPNPGGPLGNKRITEHPPRRKDGLPMWLGYVVSRYWPNESGWFNGVVTDKKEGDAQYCITYELGNPTESCEWVSLDLNDASTCITSDKVNLLSTYPTTKAVMGSEVLRLFQAKSLSGSKNKRRASDEGADFL